MDKACSFSLYCLGMCECQTDCQCSHSLVVSNHHNQTKPIAKSTHQFAVLPKLILNIKSIESYHGYHIMQFIFLMSQLIFSIFCAIYNHLYIILLYHFNMKLRIQLDLVCLQCTYNILTIQLKVAYSGTYVNELS